MLETANVTKVPYLLNVTNYYFIVFFGEARMISTIKLYNSAIATGYSSFKFVCCNQNGSVPKIWWITTLMHFAYIGVYGRVIENFYCWAFFWLSLSLSPKSLWILLKNWFRNEFCGSKLWVIKWVVTGLTIVCNLMILLKKQLRKNKNMRYFFTITIN